MTNGPTQFQVDVQALKRSLSQAMACDRISLARRLNGLARRMREGLPIDRGLAAWRRDWDASRVERARRRDWPWSIEHDPELPISAHAGAIRAALERHPLIIVAGETGSGKTTQLPKMCLAAGRGVDGWIGCTQPRRIAARAVAARLAEELDAQVGQAVGYQVRFDERMGPQSQVKVMTDGVLLSEIPSDRALDRYDTLIIDEAHERSLNIDFILGYLKTLLPRRPELRVIITSATIDTERFSAHFDQAPVVEVSGRSYPVEVRYRSLVEDQDEQRDLPGAIVDAVDELSRVDPRGDVLVFLPGEQDIRETMDALTHRKLRHTEVLPLYARLSAAEQNQIFHPGAARRVILSTNVAETSLTVPRIRFVIDSGLARISRYSHRSKVQRLPIEAVSQASANQRTGRCGRLGPGVCIRLFDEDDFDRRPAYTEPEIVRTNLASVILQMEVLGLGALDAFPFLDRPDDRLIRDGFQLLFELGALGDQRKITSLGRELARWPLDVRLGRLVVAGRDGHCLDEALTLAAALSIQDPRERPLDAQGAADQAHAQWLDPGSDFVAYLKLWRAWTQARKTRGQSKLRAWCRERFLSFVRMREWGDIRRQLESFAKDCRWPASTGGDDIDSVHRAVLAAYASHVGIKDEKDYLGARGRRFQVFPGSGLFSSQPAWLVCAFLVETARVYARVNACINPEWVEQVAGHLVKRHYFDPYWSKRSGRVMGYEQVTLYGLPLVQRRRIHYGPHDPDTARALFIRGALVQGQVNIKAPFLVHNREQVAQVEALEDRRRRRDLLVDEETLAAFFDQRLPEGIHNTRDFERWRREAEKDHPEILFFGAEDILAREDHGVADEDYPDAVEVAGVAFPVSYALDPGGAGDGLTIHVPLARLNTMDPGELEWLVPGLRHEKVTALIKSLPKVLRRQFVPAPDVAREFLEAHPEPAGSLTGCLARFLGSRSSLPMSPGDFDESGLPAHLRVNVAVTNEDGTVDQSRDLDELEAEWAEDAREEFLSQAGQGYYLDGLTEWPQGELPVEVTLEDGAAAYPALVDQEDGVGVRLFESVEEASAHHRYGVRRLCELTLKDKFRYLHRSLTMDPALSLAYSPVDTVQSLKDDVVFAVSMAVLDEDGHDPVRTRDGFSELAETMRLNLLTVSNRLLKVLGESMAAFHQARMAIGGDFSALFPTAHEDLVQQLDYLVYPGFLTEVSLARLRHYPRYLAAANRRIERLGLDPASDAERQERIQGFWDDYIERSQWDDSASLDGFHWMLEEYRVSLFAQELKTAHPVSPKRLARAWAQLTESDG